MAKRYCSREEESRAAHSSGRHSQALSQNYTIKNGVRKEKGKSS
jgi:hypothetical protein